MVALVGEPGVGKSRLVLETTGAAEADGWTVLQAGAASYGTATPYLPVIDLLQADTAGSRRRTTPRRSSRRSGAGCSASTGPWHRRCPPLLALLDAPVEDAAWAALDPPGRRRATLDALTRLLLRESRERPLLLVVEDLHWLDSESQALLDALVDGLPTARILLLVNYQTRVHPRLGQQGPLHPAPDRRAGAGQRRGVCSRRCWARMRRSVRSRRC